MGAFVDRNDVNVVQDEGWETWEEATIGKLDTAAYDRIRAEVMRITGDRVVDKDGKVVPITKAQHTAARAPVVYEGLMASGLPWTFTANNKPPSENNEPVPITRETVGALKRRVSEFLYNEVNEFNEDWTDEERAEFFRRTESGVSGRGAVPA